MAIAMAVSQHYVHLVLSEFITLAVLVAHADPIRPVS